MEESASNDIWAVVISGASKYVGKINDVGGEGTALETEVLKLRPVYELMILRMPGQHPQTGDVVLRQEVRLLPLGVNSHDMAVYTKWNDIWFLSDMNEADRKQYLKMIKDVVADQQAQRAKDSNITLATHLPTGRGRG